VFSSIVAPPANPSHSHQADDDETGRWTPPLWGIGLTETVVGGTATYLHDGRTRSLARSLEEAILWHGGEAEAARRWFQNAPAEDHTALIAFLRSL